MRCDDALNKLNARADGELPPGEWPGLHSHLADCSQCRSAAESLDTIDGELRQAFASRREAASRLADNVAARIRAEALPRLPLAVRRAPDFRLAWGQALMAAAFGFLLAVVIFQPWQSNLPRPPRPAAEPIARLAIASGPVEVSATAQTGILCCPPAPIGPGSIVRTGPSTRCELALENGGALGLDFDTEVNLQASGVVEICRGRLWSCSQPGAKACEIVSRGGTIVPGTATELAVECQAREVRVIVVRGMVNVQTEQTSLELVAGKQAQIVLGKVGGTPQTRDALLETVWVNSLLALRSGDHRELVQRVNHLLASAGSQGLSLAYEDELRRLGDDGAPALLAYLAATRTTPQLAGRAATARIVADVVQQRWVADLIGLLDDENAEVRFYAASGLTRLTGRDQGCAPSIWQAAPRSACQQPYQQWLDWWSANRDRYPATQHYTALPAPPRL